MKLYNNVYVFGDSYSTPKFCVDIEDSFWHLVADEVNATTIHNYSNSGNSLESIIHLITSDQESFDWNGLFLIGIPPLERLAFWDEDKSSNYPLCVKTTISDGNIHTDVIQSRETLINVNTWKLGKEYVTMESRDWTEAQALRDLYLLESWLTHEKHANFVFVNLSKKFILNDLMLTSKVYINKIINMPNAIIFSDNTYHNINLNIHKPADYDEAGWNGHHGPDGNRNFYNNGLKPALIKSNLI
jgi:hypothetical protein